MYCNTCSIIAYKTLLPTGLTRMAYYVLTRLVSMVRAPLTLSASLQCLSWVYGVRVSVTARPPVAVSQSVSIA